MAEYKVQAPDGKMLTIEGPDDATDQQLQEQAAKLYGQHQQSQKTEKSGPVEPVLTDEQKFAKMMRPGPIQNFVNSAMNTAMLGIPNAVASIGNPEFAKQLKEQESIGSDIAGSLLPMGAGVKAGVGGVNAVVKGAQGIAGNRAVAEAAKSNPLVAGAWKSYQEAIASGVPEAIRVAKNRLDALSGPLKEAAISQMNKFVPNAGKVLGGVGGALGGAQLGAAAPDIMRGNIGEGQLKAHGLNTMVDNIPLLGSAVTNTAGQVVPFGLAALENVIHGFKKDKKE